MYILRSAVHGMRRKRAKGQSKKRGFSDERGKPHVLLQDNAAIGAVAAFVKPALAASLEMRHVPRTSRARIDMCERLHTYTWQFDVRQCKSKSCGCSRHVRTCTQTKSKSQPLRLQMKKSAIVTVCCLTARTQSCLSDGDIGTPVSTPLLLGSSSTVVSQ